MPVSFQTSKKQLYLQYLQDETKKADGEREIVVGDCTRLSKAEPIYCNGLPFTLQHAKAFLAYDEQGRKTQHYFNLTPSCTVHCKYPSPRCHNFQLYSILRFIAIQLNGLPFTLRHAKAFVPYDEQGRKTQYYFNLTPSYTVHCKYSILKTQNLFVVFHSQIYYNLL